MEVVEYINYSASPKLWVEEMWKRKVDDAPKAISQCLGQLVVTAGAWDDRGGLPK
jgi:hypothetical protein